MTDQNAVSAFRAARADAVKRYAGADLETVCAAWVANQKFLDGART